MPTATATGDASAQTTTPPVVQTAPTTTVDAARAATISRMQGVWKSSFRRYDAAGMLTDLQRRMPIVRSAWPVVEAVGDGVEFVLAVDRQVGALGQVLAKQAILCSRGCRAAMGCGSRRSTPERRCLRPGRRVVTFPCLGRRSPSAGRRLRVSLRSPCRWVTA